MVRNAKAISVFNKVGGTLLIGAGVATAQREQLITES
jgi:hypothetical protein